MLGRVLNTPLASDHSRYIYENLGAVVFKEHSQVFYNIDVHKNYEKLIEKHLSQILFPEHSACIVMKKAAPAQGFSCESFEIFTNAFFTEHLWLASDGSFYQLP